jgi:hypothetical protein
VCNCVREKQVIETLEKAEKKLDKVKTKLSQRDKKIWAKLEQKIKNM